jgi:hypothetical protein
LSPVLFVCLFQLRLDHHIFVFSNRLVAEHFPVIYLGPFVDYRMLVSLISLSPNEKLVTYPVIWML